MGLRSPYPPFHAAFMRPPCRGRRRLWDFYMDSWAPRPLWFCLEGSYTHLKNPKSLARRHVGGIRIIPARAPRGGRTLKNGTVAPRSSHHLRAASARKPHGLRTITVWRLQRLHGKSTEIARFPYNLRAASLRIYPGLTPMARDKKSHDAHRQCEQICLSPEPPTIPPKLHRKS